MIANNSIIVTWVWAITVKTLSLVGVHSRGMSSPLETQCLHNDDALPY